MAALLRPSRAIIRVSGPEAQKFLFDVLTGRLLAEPGPPVRWALLSPQGKIQVEGLSLYADGAFFLSVERAFADAFLKKLKLYRLRAAVEISDLRESHGAIWDGTDPLSLGVVTAAEAASLAADDLAYDRARLVRCIPELGADFLPDSTFPHDVGMDILGGVDFAKGCYIGQEVVSRMQHRGTARRRPVLISPVTAPAFTPVLVGGRDSGQIGRPVDGKAIAIVRLDRFDGSPVTVDGAPVAVTLPDWAPWRLGESAPAD